MKKYGFLFIFLIALFFTSCVSLPNNMPESGIWYCSELNTSIDFSLNGSEEPNLKIYKDDGLYELAEAKFDYGDGVFFYKLPIESNDIGYLIGRWKFTDNQFIVTTSKGEKYIFVET